MKVALIQIKLKNNPQSNIERAFEMVREAGDADLIVLPESFSAPFGTEVLDDYDDLLARLSELAVETGSTLVAGTVPERDGEDFYNTCTVFSPEGEVLSKYRKIHLFDVDIGSLHTRESERYRNGDKTEVFETPSAKIGLAVCYDLRFPGQFTELADKGAEVIVVPAAFSEKTGRVHWELLNRARALDSQCFILACAPAENPELPFPVYGHSLVVDPNGEVIARLDGDEGILYADIEPSVIPGIRESLPVTRTRREVGK